MSREARWREDWAACMHERFAAATAGKAGLVKVAVEQRPFPLWLRAGTDDVAAATASFDPKLGGLALVHEPRRILEIGAGAGFRTAALAQAYPGAEIIAAEADPACLRTARLNTLPYSGVTCLNTVISAGSARYGFHGRVGAEGRLALTLDATGPLASTPLAHFLSHWRWRDVDTMVISPDAAALEILTLPPPANLRLLAVETGGEALAPELAEPFRLGGFLTVISGDYVLFYRRENQKAPPAMARECPVFQPDGPVRPLWLENVREGGFFHVGQHGFRLAPNAAGEPLARLVIGQESLGYGELQVSMRVPRDDAPPVRFSVKMRSETGMVLGAVCEVVQGGMARGVVLYLPEQNGPCEIVFTTEMAEPGARADGVWAEFISATLV